MHEIVSIHLSGGLSGTVHSAQQAREQLGEAAERVHVVDSATACGGEGLMLMAAAAAISGGGDAAAAAQRAQQARESLQFLFSLETLEYLRKGGRIGGAQAWLGSALKIKPILSLESEIGAVERVRTTRRAFERLVTLDRAAQGRRRRRLGRPAHADAQTRPRRSPSAGARSSAPIRCGSPRSAP